MHTEQVVDDEQVIQLAGQATQLTSIVVYPVDGQLLMHEVLRRKYLSIQVEQEKAPFRQVLQGLTQEVQVP